MRHSRRSEQGAGDLLAFIIFFPIIFVVMLALPILIPMGIAASTGTPETAKQAIQSITDAVAAGFIERDEAEQRAIALMEMTNIPTDLVQVRCGEVDIVQGLMRWSGADEPLMAGDRFACTATGNVSHWPLVAPVVREASGFTFQVEAISVTPAGDDDAISS